MRSLSTVLFVLFSICIAACGVSKKIDEVQHTQVPQVTAADEMAARLRLDSIAKAEAQYQVMNNGAYGTMQDLIQNQFLVDPSKGQLGRYKFDLEVGEHGFAATAVPERYPMTGRRSFYIDESGVLRGADKAGAKATASDPAL